MNDEIERNERICVCEWICVIRNNNNNQKDVDKSHVLQIMHVVCRIMNENSRKMPVSLYAHISFSLYGVW